MLALPLRWFVVTTSHLLLSHDVGLVVVAVVFVVVVIVVGRCEEYIARNGCDVRQGRAPQHVPFQHAANDVTQRLHSCRVNRKTSCRVVVWCGVVLCRVCLCVSECE